MVSPQITSLTAAYGKPISRNQLLLSTGPPDALPSSDHVEFDFSDVFGPVPVQNMVEVSSENAKNLDGNELIYDDPDVICTRSHSLVGPSSYVSQSLKLGKLTLHETEETLELVEEVSSETKKGVGKPSIDVGVNCYANCNDALEERPVGLEDFEVLKVVGQGAFAKVYQVRKSGTTEIYAMKVMRKDKIVEKNHAEYMKSERDILTKVDHPFIVQLRYSFQTIPCAGFCEWWSPFLSALSSRLVQVMLTDFGLAKQFDENTRSNSMCGTLEYMAPEIILGKGHDKAADWWSVGILLYEMLTGKPPFVGGNRQKIQEKILKDKMKMPSYLSSEAHSLLKGLLQKDVSKRLGSGASGSKEIKQHKWFKVINWNKLDGRGIKPSFLPEVAGTHCVANFEECWTNMPLSDSPIASPKFDVNPFKGFTYEKPAASFLQRNA
ncbi:hypothetical protein ACFE04_018341 [Oxalis oulophora]